MRNTRGSSDARSRLNKFLGSGALTLGALPVILQFVEVFTHSATAPALPEGPLSRVAQLVQPQLDQVETRIAQQAAAFDPAIEGYVAYAIGSRGKRLASAACAC